MMQSITHDGPAVTIEDVSKKFGATMVLDDINFDVDKMRSSCCSVLREAVRRRSSG
jgi:ABC-type transporter Mla maintaining outer membrane lipid asymmetry ATPase subunit MlaF